MVRALPFVAIVCASALAAAWYVAMGAARVSGPQVYAALMLAALGVAAEMLNFEQARKGTAGSIALIPFAAAGLCAPSWVSIAAIGLGSELCRS